MPALAVAAIVGFVLAAAVPARADGGTGGAGGPGSTGGTLLNPVIPGAFPDPTIVGYRGGYWALSTSGNEAPVFPIMHSTDLVNWEQTGAVFDRPPAWTDGAYWAPQLTHYGNRFLLYYAARRRGAHPCIAVAVAKRPGGPYSDRGPIVCRHRGSIDPMMMVAPGGQPYLLWKQMGLGHGLWIQPTNSRGTGVVGSPTLMLSPDQRWERGVTENPYLVAANGQYYLLYSGGTCCRLPCSYAVGVARATTITGPYVKDPHGPIFASDPTWRCPGGVSLVDGGAGSTYLLFHAYRVGEEYVGRQGLVDRLAWGPDGWPLIGNGRGPRYDVAAPPGSAQVASRRVAEDFGAGTLTPGWQWRFDQRPRFRFVRRELRIAVTRPGDELAAYMGRRVVSSSYRAVVAVDRRTLRPATLAGLAVYGGPRSVLGLGIQKSKVVSWEHGPQGDQHLATLTLPASPIVWLRVDVVHGRQVSFAWSLDRRTWTPVTSAPVTMPVRPFDEQVMLTVQGRPGAVAGFRRFLLAGPG